MRKFARRAICLVLALIMVFGMMPTVEADAFDRSKDLILKYSETVQAGKIRYVAQQNSKGVIYSNYYHKEYWGEHARYGCYAATTSMVLSYLGINATPLYMKSIGLYGKSKDSYDDKAWEQNGYITERARTLSDKTGIKITPVYTSREKDVKTLKEAISNFKNSNGQYSPPIVYVGCEGNMHAMVAVDYNPSSDTFTVVDPLNENTTKWKNTGIYYNAKESGSCEGQYYDLAQYKLEHIHKWNQLGYCTESGCTVKDKDFLNTSAANYAPIKAGTVTPKYDKLDVYARPYKDAKIIDTKYKKFLLFINKDIKPLKAKARLNNRESNKNPELWYEVELDGGQKGYVYSGDVTLDAKSNVLTSVSMSQTSITQGTSVWLEGRGNKPYYSVKASTSGADVQDLAKVKVGIYDANGKAVYTIPEKVLDDSKFIMTNSDDQKLLFSSLAPGQYYLKIEAWDKLDIKGEAQCAFTVVAKNVETRKITFDANGGSGAQSQMNIQKGNVLNLGSIKRPTRKDFNLIGWSTNKWDTTPMYKVNDSFKPGNNMTLYAIWEAIEPPTAPTMTVTNLDIAMGTGVNLSWTKQARADSYTVTAYNEDGTEYRRVTVNGTLTTMLFEDAGTYTVRVKANNSVGSSEESEGVSIIAHEPSIVTFVDYNGNKISEQNVSYGGSAVLPDSPPERKGYKFDSWEGSYTNVKEDRTITARYRAIEYTVKFLDCNGKVAKTEVVTYDGDEPGFATPPDELILNIPEGYVLVGWNTNEYEKVTQNDIVVKPSIIWGNADLPIQVSLADTWIDGESTKVCAVSYELENHSMEEKTGRVVVVLKSNFGKFLTKTESNVFYLGAEKATSGIVYIPLNSVPEGEIFTTIELYAVENYSSLIPISKVETYNVISEDGDWSKWMTPEEFAEFSGDYTDIETKTQYSTRTKNTYTTTNPIYLDWELESTSTTKSSWSAWSDWQDTAVTADDNCEVETRVVTVTAAHKEYRYGRYVSTSSGYDYEGDYYPSGWAHFHQAFYAGGGYKTEYTAWSNTQIKPTNTNYYCWGSNNAAKTGKNVSGTYYWNRYSVSGKTYFWEASKDVAAVTKTQYQYRTRTDIPEYTFYKWSDWSDWSDDAVTGTENLEVQTRELIRVKLPEPSEEGVYHISGSLNTAEAEGKIAIVTVYKVDEASDYSNEYMGQIEIGENGAYSIDFRTLEEPSVATGDFTVTLTIEGANEPVYIGTIEAPKPTYTVEFVDMDGNRIGDAQTVELGGSAVAPEVPSKEGYIFIGWEYGLTNIRDNMVIAARYIPEKYTVVFVDWANYTVTMQTDIPYGTVLECPNVVAPDGYNFIGWEAPEGYDINHINGSMVVMANYEQISYTVRYLDSNGEVLYEHDVRYGEASEFPEDVEFEVPENMYFEGWSGENIDAVTESVDVIPEFRYIEDTEAAESSLESGVYEGKQTIELNCADAEADIRYHIVGTETIEATFEPYNGPIEISETTVIEVITMASQKNDTVEFFEYIIVPEDSAPDAPSEVRLSSDEQKVTVEWDSVAGADGYVIKKTDIYGCGETFTTTDLNYIDYNVSGIDEYTYEVFAYRMIGDENGQTMLESKSGTSETILFYGLYKFVSEIEIVIPEKITVGDNFILNAVVKPSEAYNSNVFWAVYNETGVATVSEDGIFSAEKAGTVTVKAFSMDGSDISAEKVITIDEIYTDDVVIKVTSVSVQKDQEAIISVSLSKNSYAKAISFTLIYDDTKLELVSAAAGKDISSSDTIINSSTLGKVYFVWDSVYEFLSNDTVLMDLVFKPKENYAMENEKTLIGIVEEGNEGICVSNSNSELIDIVVKNGLLQIINLNVGDVNGDGYVNVIDANLIRRYAVSLVEFTDEQKAVADVNHDGMINVVDAYFIRRYAAFIIDKLP
ncbi:MAG: InlB B-repeat-containing protein [Oscillospiraceae bacterium]